METKIKLIFLYSFSLGFLTTMAKGKLVDIVGAIGLPRWC